jgi:chemotaxis protein methyltransferase CheR
MKDAIAKLFNVEPLSPKEFECFSDLFRNISGIHIKEDKKGLVDSRLRKKLLELQLSPMEYFKLLQQNNAELSDFVSALTTHKTDWFREPIHYRVIEDYLRNKKPKAPYKKSLSHPFSCWSAACSTGEEVYSLAMTLDQTRDEVKNWKILGSDISSHCVEHAKKGIYVRDVVEKQVIKEKIKRYFLQNIDPKYKDLYMFTPEFESKINFTEYNLVKSKHTPGTSFDVIFLRNVLIYFEKDVISFIIKQLYNYLKPGGLLILGLAESISHPEQFKLKRLESSVYLK